MKLLLAELLNLDGIEVTDYHNLTMLDLRNLAVLVFTISLLDLVIPRHIKT